MSVRRLGAATAAVVLGAVALATPAAAQTATQTFVLTADQTVYGWTPERVWSTTAALLAVAGVIIGGWAFRSARGIGGNGRKGAIVALAAGLIAVVNGVLNIVTADGGPGTGNGVVGGGIAIALGLSAAALGWLALARSRSTA